MKTAAVTARQRDVFSAAAACHAYLAGQMWNHQPANKKFTSPGGRDSCGPIPGKNISIIETGAEKSWQAAGIIGKRFRTLSQLNVSQCWAPIVSNRWSSLRKMKQIQWIVMSSQTGLSRVWMAVNKMTAKQTGFKSKHRHGPGFLGPQQGKLVCTILELFTRPPGLFVCI